MPNPENITNVTPEEASARGRKAGIESGKARRAKKKMAEELQILLSLPVKRSTKNKAMKLLDSNKAKAFEDFRGMNTTVQTQILLKIIQMATNGNVKAIEFIANLTGETKQTIDINANADVRVNKPVDTLADDLFGDDE